MSTKRVSLSLGGGAARGVFHLGVLQKLDEIGIKIKAISGSSIGAFAAVCYSGGMSPKEILEIAKIKEFKKVFKPNLSFKSLIKIDETSKIVEKLLPVKNLTELKIPTYVACTDLVSGEIIYFVNGDPLKIVLGSCALVPFFPAIEYDEFLLADGGFMDNLPIKPLKEHNFPIVGVDLHPPHKVRKAGLVQNTRRALTLCVSQNTASSKKECDVFITNEKVGKYPLFTFRKYDELFKLGYDSVDMKKFENLEKR